jgi:hypothetical protein
MPDFPASDQSCTGIKKNSDAGTLPVPEKGNTVLYRNAPVPDREDAGRRNADTRGINLDVDVQGYALGTLNEVL